MKKLTALLLSALLVVPFISSCEKDDEGPQMSVLATVLPFWNEAGFAIQMDNGETMYPGKVRVNYKVKDEAQRAIIQFSKINTPIEGFTYNADIYNIVDLDTKEIKVAKSSDEKLGSDGIEIVEAFIGGGYLNIEFKVNIDPYSKEQTHVVELVDNQINGEPKFSTHYPLELRFRRAHSLQGEKGQTVSNIACFYLGRHTLDRLNCQGYELKFMGLDNDGKEDPEGSHMQSVKITPAASNL
ncbi:MAG: NigD-like N-terminal domain-containing protein [Bacteroidales bacterium]|nr:NigD-like N-terminal domain-containing protein [Bacteroidales bacterium]